MSIASWTVPTPAEPGGGWKAQWMAETAASMIEQVGEAAVRAHLPQLKIIPPKPGFAVLACRCGAVLGRTDMHRLPLPAGNRAVVSPIVCGDCARDRAW